MITVTPTECLKSALSMRRNQRCSGSDGSKVLRTATHFPFTLFFLTSSYLCNRAWLKWQDRRSSNSTNENSRIFIRCHLNNPTRVQAFHLFAEYSRASFLSE